MPESPPPGVALSGIGSGVANVVVAAAEHRFDFAVEPAAEEDGVAGLVIARCQNGAGDSAVVAQRVARRRKGRVGVLRPVAHVSDPVDGVAVLGQRGVPQQILGHVHPLGRHRGAPARRRIQVRRVDDIVAVGVDLIIGPGKIVTTRANFARLRPGPDCSSRSASDDEIGREQGANALLVRRRGVSGGRIANAPRV